MPILSEEFDQIFVENNAVALQDDVESHQCNGCQYKSIILGCFKGIQNPFIKEYTVLVINVITNQNTCIIAYNI